MKVRDYPPGEDRRKSYVYHAALKIPPRNRTISYNFLGEDGFRRVDYFHLAFPELIFYQRSEFKEGSCIFAFCKINNRMYPFPFCNVSYEGKICLPIICERNLVANISFFWNTQFTSSFPSWAKAWNDRGEIGAIPARALRRWAKKTKEDPNFMKNGIPIEHVSGEFHRDPIDNYFLKFIQKLI